MKVLYTTPSKPEADALVACLADEAIDAAVVSRVDPYLSTHTNFDVLLRTADDLALAQSILETFHTTSSELAEPLDEQFVPDLTHLDPSLLPDCPGCNNPLPPDASLTFCPRCNTPVDIIDLIITRHGPEAFASPPDPVSRFCCARCGYPRRGLPDPEICPECGTPFPPSA